MSAVDLPDPFIRIRSAKRISASQILQTDPLQSLHALNQMKSRQLPNERFREWLDGVNNRTRKLSLGMNGQPAASENSHQHDEWILSPTRIEHQAYANGPRNQTENLRDVGNTATNALQRQLIDTRMPPNGVTCPIIRSSTHPSVRIAENGSREVAMDIEKLHLGNGLLNQVDNSQSIFQQPNSNGFENVEGNGVALSAVQRGDVNVTINGNANDDRDDNGLLAEVGHVAGPHAEEIDPNIPAWASATPVDGYIMHPVAGLVMHPSFYDNRHLIKLATYPRYIYDGEVDGPLCPVGKKCDHVKNCFEVRVRMAVLAYLRHHISFRDAEYIWSVSRSTIQRRKAAMEKHSPLIFLLTPENTVE